MAAIGFGVAGWALATLLRKPMPKVEAQAGAAVDDLAQQIVLELGEKLDALKDFDQLATRKAQLEVEVGALKQQRAEIEAVFIRKQADLEHRAGLQERQRDQEIVEAKGKAELAADRRVLEAERGFVKERMEAQQTAFDERVKAMREVTEKLFDLVPDLKAKLHLTGTV
jgi:chromosome segregation ATPase